VKYENEIRWGTRKLMGLEKILNGTVLNFLDKFIIFLKDSIKISKI
jgi:hypothetical protein